MSAAAGATADPQRAPPAPVEGAPSPVPFGRDWYQRDSVSLARALLGQLLVRDIDGQQRVARIVETEAYAGTADRASHARAGRTRRTEPMFGPAGHAYVYLVYGIHHCLNVVAATAGVPAAVLIRAASPATSVDAMRRARRGPKVPDVRLLAGPGLVCAGMSIDRGLDGHDLTTGDELWIGPGPGSAVPDVTIVHGPRIGVAYAGPGWADRPWRFGIAGDPALSKPFPTAVTANQSRA